ncbi:MAG: glycosyltransferase [Actinocatenispora sp.]
MNVVQTSTGDRLRIVVGADTYPPDVNGAAHFSHQLASGLARRGHDVHVLAPSPDGRPGVAVLDGVTVHRVRARRTPWHSSFRVCPPWQASAAADTVLGTLKPDLVHIQAHFVVGRALSRAASRHGVPLVATNHFMPENLFGYVRLPAALHEPVRRLAWWDVARVFGPAAVVTAPTPRAVQLLHERGVGRRALAVSCGIDLSRFAAPASAGAGVRRPETLDRVGVPGDIELPRRAELLGDAEPPRHNEVPGSPDAADGGPVAEESAVPTVLFVGRLDAEKRIEELLGAAALLASTLPFRVELVGDGSRRAEWEALAERLGLADRVVFAGHVTEAELVAAYRRSDVFCMPGIAELQSLATMEAMAAGKPVIAADAMALPHLVRDGDNGRLYRPGDVAGLASRLSELLVDARLRERMGEAGRRRILAHDVAATLDRFEEVYREALGVEPLAVRRPVLAGTAA